MKKLITAFILSIIFIIVFCMSAMAQEETRYDSLAVYAIKVPNPDTLFGLGIKSINWKTGEVSAIPMAVITSRKDYREMFYSLVFTENPKSVMLIPYNITEEGKKIIMFIPNPTNKQE